LEDVKETDRSFVGGWGSTVDLTVFI
jgi:hypothetical protein